MKHLLLVVFLLLPLCTFAQQAQVMGRVLDDKTGMGMAGVTILQKGTNNGVSSDDEGYFTLGQLGSADSVTLQVSSIGYVNQVLQVKVGSQLVIRLAASDVVFCDLPVYAKLTLGVFSGVRYAPFGVQLRKPRLFQRPVSGMVSYQTNLRRNYALYVGVGLPDIRPRNRLHFTETLAYQQLRAEAAGVRFNSYSATVGLSIYRIGHLRVPDLLLGAGYSRYHPLPAADQLARTGYGYSLGLRHDFLPYPVRLQAQFQATRWPGYWQLQGQLLHPITIHNIDLQLGLQLNQLRNYREVTAAVNYTFF